MILDYHLNKNRPSDGGDAIGVLRGLANNDHFNLVVVYTKGYEDPGGDIPRVVQEIAIGLCSEDDRLAISDERQCVVKRFLEDWEDDQPHIVEKI